MRMIILYVADNFTLALAQSWRRTKCHHVHVVVDVLGEKEGAADRLP